MTTDIERHSSLDDKPKIEHDDPVDYGEHALVNIAVERIAEAPDFADGAKEANDREHALSFRDGCRHYPGSLFWGIGMSFTIVMEGYITSLSRNFITFPAFARKYGVWQEAQQRWVINAKWQVAMGNMGMIGTLIGLVIMGFVADKFGHRYVMMVGLVLIVAFNFMTFFAPTVKILATAGLLGGIPNGLFGILGSVYASEVAPLPIRGFLTSFVNISWIIGQFAASGLMTRMVKIDTVWSFRIPMAITWAWPVPLFIMAIFAPNSPWWCVRHGDYAGAERSLRRLASSKYVTAADTRRSLALLVRTNELEKSMKTKASVWECFRGTNLRRTEIASMTLATQAFSGQTFAYGATYFFVMAGLSTKDAYNMGFVSTGAAFVATCISWVLNGWVGRRPLIIYGFSVMTGILLVIGGLALVDKQSHIWAQAGLCVVWLFVYSMTIGPQSFGLAAEVSATRLRSQTLAIARFFYVLMSFLCNTVEPYLINPTALNLKGKTAFVWFGTSFLTVIWCIFRMPETKGITYTELDLLFEHRVAAWRFKSTKVDVTEEIEE
ncbi:hypothetical protein VHUM_03659 [Vanrija humicola]|uniref:Major facilitator superfamily (MFS) profile domain-containing protein n=1 Tax=Vanrija humicola TaxID=5417 RepID=A0A7D8Z1R7_VANHU|nr:hypothetical protein VHUM_03659 [Vanrija humicola]